MTADRADQSLFEAFPPVYRRMLTGVFEKEVPVERLATCSRCAMCRSADESSAAPGVVHYDPAVKCCSFHPALANFLVGAILADQDPAMSEGKARVRAAIASRRTCWPTGLEVPAVYAHLYKHKGPDVFGQSPSMRCPYFQDGDLNCTIWRHRNATCSTWFCKHVAGEDGRDFWVAAQKQVGFLEWLLPRHFMQVLGIEPNLADPDTGDRALSRDDIEHRVGQDRYTAAWGRWAGREEEFFVECHRLALQLEADDVRRIAGTLQSDIHGQRLEKAHDRLVNPVLPDPLLRNPDLSVRVRDAGKVHVSSGGLNGIEISAELLELLWQFDGKRSNVEALARIEERGARLTRDLQLGLHRHRLLISARPGA